MKVSFHLRKLPAAEPASALLLLAQRAEDLLRLCARLGSSGWPAVYPVPGGFLVKLDQPADVSFPNTIRLRRLSDNLLLPADAELTPPLHEDEAKALVRDRGLVFLPGGRVLGFAVDSSLPLAALVSAGELRRQSWQPLPAGRPLAEQIEEILLDRPDESPAAVLEAGGEDIGTEEPRPDDSSLPRKLLGQAQYGAGKGLMGVGNLLGLPGLARLGAQWMQGALGQVPRLTEAILGRQEAALRELLRQFREGNLEQALRRALPLGGPGGRGSVAATDAQLPTHKLLYSLANILSGSGGGRASVWLGGYDVQQELAREYRKAAEAAVRAGDYRRAAFIYGKLMHDYRLAADTLFQGGLYHDAAILYLHQLEDSLAAARAFEMAGEHDRALQLYRQRDEHVLAGDLLRRLGEEDEAVQEYLIAAEQQAVRGDHLAAGELMLNKAKRADLAVDYFQDGWALRPQANAVPCALQLARLHAQQESPDALLALACEADAFFRPAGNDVAAGQFYNELARLADHPNLAGVRDDLRDRALMGIAVKLRQRAEVEARAGNIVSGMMVQARSWAPAPANLLPAEGNPWPAPVISDADFAVKAAVGRGSTDDRPSRAENRVRVGTGMVTAACHAPRTGEVFVGFANGEVVCFRPTTGEVIPCPFGSYPVLSLAADAEGELLAAVYQLDQSSNFLASYAKSPDGTYWRRQRRALEGTGTFWLTPLIEKWDSDYLVGLWDGERLAWMYGPLLLAAGNPLAPFVRDNLTAALVLGAGASSSPTLAVLGFDPDETWCFTRCWQGLHKARLGWRPGIPPGSPLKSVPLSWVQPDPSHLQLVGLSSDGALCWSSLQFGDGQLNTLATNVSTGPEVYQAAALVRTGLVAGVNRSRINWLRGGHKGFSLWTATRVELPSVAACFPSPRTDELIVVCADGWVERVPVPS